MPPFTLILFYLGRKVGINMRLRSVQMDNVSDLVIVQGFACSFEYLPLVIYSSVFLLYSTSSLSPLPSLPFFTLRLVLFTQKLTPERDCFFLEYSN